MGSGMFLHRLWGQSLPSDGWNEDRLQPLDAEADAATFQYTQAANATLREA